MLSHTRGCILQGSQELATQRLAWHRDRCFRPGIGMPIFRQSAASDAVAPASATPPRPGRAPSGGTGSIWRRARTCRSA
uniref:Uncharacterized protein n=1 Tax=Arundo donax TaxID=35708 RepID=A0A0A8ZF46_ARUDO